ncbi:MAG: NAD(P)H-hydrate dehydratase [bacterium]|nr:NAD(P)H-hydrate dehydratase [bacterium]
MNIISIQSSDISGVESVLKQLYIPEANSHKGNNGKALIIGGSSLFHSASLWSAEIASHFVDMVHYASTKENNEIFVNLKSLFHNGIVVRQEDIDAYVEEDDAVLIGPGMVRGEDEEASYARALTHRLLKDFPHKRFVIDAGALQMINAAWLKELKEPAIITPHKKEFKQLFDIDVSELSEEEIALIVQQKAHEYSCIILLKSIQDYISDGEEVYIVRGGNQGLTKGGSGDILAGLTVGLFSKSEALVAAVSASYGIKTAADELYNEKGYWYNMEDIIDTIPGIFAKSLL